MAKLIKSINDYFLKIRGLKTSGDLCRKLYTTNFDENIIKKEINETETQLTKLNNTNKPRKQEEISNVYKNICKTDKEF